MKWWILLSMAWCVVARAAAIEVSLMGETAAAGRVEIVGVGAGEFDAARWAEHPPRFVADVRWPMIEPVKGNFRNIYAPSVVETPQGWRVFFGGWDGQVDGHDRIYSMETTNFLSFSNRKKIIEHGAFDHVCNVSAVRNPNGSFDILCTAYPDVHGKNKPIHFSSPDGEKWNGASDPFPATAAELVSVDGYPDYPGADINGMNVLLREGDTYSMFFADFAKFGHVYRATSNDAQHFRVTGECLSEPLAVNDVKKIGKTYLMALHMDRGSLYYTLSGDPEKFPPSKVLFDHRGIEDQFMVADGWVTRGNRVLGILYGAGADPHLTENRIFARWVQKRVVFVGGAAPIEANQSRGPDRAVLDVSAPTRGHFAISTEFGEKIGQSDEMAIEPGKVYRIGAGRAGE